MLRFLSIQNLAVIDTIDLEVLPGLTILTGETGAGKSVVVEAVGLLLGGRASPDVVRTGEPCATIQAIFDTVEGEELIVRREINAQGRSRAFVNGNLATAGALRECMTPLVDLHGQHDHQALLDPQNHLDLLDAYGGFTEQRQAVAESYAALGTLQHEVDHLRNEERHASARREALTFALQELEGAALRRGEDEELAATRQVLAHAEKLRRLCAEGYASLYENDQAVLTQLAGLWRRLEELAALDDKFRPHLESRGEISARLEDLAFFLRAYAHDMDASPIRLQEIEDRLALIERMKRKYGPTLNDAILRLDAARRELEELETVATRSAERERALDAQKNIYLGRAADISRARRGTAEGLARALERLCAELALEHTRVEVRFRGGDHPNARWTARGTDDVELFVSPNPGEDLRPLANIVSGGEMSRLMLSIKTLVSTDAPGKTLIFDEVDAGIGGRVADVVGRKLEALSHQFQVLCITHLPQIAAYGAHHFHVSKEIKQARTVTQVTRLDGFGRVEELARMLAGAEVSERARASARELLARTRGGTL